MAVMSAAAVTTPAYAQQDKKAFCLNYADEAIELYRKYIRYSCGERDLRWHDWWDGHYGWCKDWVSADRVEDEQDLRRIRVDKCLNDQGGSRDDRRSRYDDRGSERRGY